MLSRDILEEQELEYAISLIEDMEREEREEREVREEREENAKSTENADLADDDDDRNPSPNTLRNMRRAYFEKLELNKVSVE